MFMKSVRTYARPHVSVSKSTPSLCFTNNPRRCDNDNIPPDIYLVDIELDIVSELEAN